MKTAEEEEQGKGVPSKVELNLKDPTWDGNKFKDERENRWWGTMVCRPTKKA